MSSLHQCNAQSYAIRPECALFAVGCFEKRVTIYSQQVRALDLGHALIEGALVRPRGNVAVIGGGIAGVTLAAGLTVAAPQTKVVLFEASNQLMHLQRGGRDRYVHPHIFDWPAQGPACTEAGLPLMNWSAGPASTVVASLEEQFQAFKRMGQVEVRLDSLVTGFSETGRSLRVVVNGAVGAEIFDAVILCIGFGLEKHLRAECPSYWSPSLLPAPLLMGKSQTEIFVSGNGDGGLADFALASFNAKDHGEILQLVSNHPQIAPLIEKLLALDDQAWSDPTFDLYNAYVREIQSELPEPLLLDIREQLRPDVRVVFHTQESRLFRRDTALLNRLVVFLALAADWHFDSKRLSIVAGKRILNPDDARTIQFENEKMFTPDVRLLRFGPDREKVRAPFSEYLNEAALASQTLQARPMTPVLKAHVDAWYRKRMSKDLEALAASVGANESDRTSTANEVQAAETGGIQINVVGGNVGAGATITQIYTGSRADLSSFKS